MSKFTSFFKGTKPSKSRETVAELRKQSSNIKIRARALKRLSNDERSMAKEFLRDGNKNAAEKALFRRKKYQADLSGLMQKAALVNRVVEAIAKAEQNDKLLRVLQASKTVLDKTASGTRLEQAEEIMMGLESAMENVDFMEERFSDSSLLDDELDVDLADISTEMDVLMSEIEAESGVKKSPAKTERKITPTRKVIDFEETDLPEAADSRDDDLKAEIARIKREMEEELG